MTGVGISIDICLGEIMISLTLERLLHVDGFLCAGLEVWDLTFGLAKGHGSF